MPAIFSYSSWVFMQVLLFFFLRTHGTAQHVVFFSISWWLLDLPVLMFSTSSEVLGSVLFACPYSSVLVHHLSLWCFSCPCSSTTDSVFLCDACGLQCLIASPIVYDCVPCCSVWGMSSIVSSASTPNFFVLRRNKLSLPKFSPPPTFPTCLKPAHRHESVSFTWVLIQGLRLRCT